MIDLIMDIKRSPNRDMPQLVSDLQTAMGRHMEAHTRASRTGNIIPTHHASRHVPSKFARDTFPFDMWDIERSNLRMKALAESISDIMNYDHQLWRYY